jgi:hypothetical protein
MIFWRERARKTPSRLDGKRQGMTKLPSRHGYRGGTINELRH